MGNSNCCTPQKDKNGQNFDMAYETEEAGSKDLLVLSYQSSKFQSGEITEREDYDLENIPEEFLNANDIHFINIEANYYKQNEIKGPNIKQLLLNKQHILDIMDKESHKTDTQGEFDINLGIRSYGINTNEILKSETHLEEPIQLTIENGIYYGETSSGVPNGKGKFSHNDGSLYIGHFKNGLKSGKGKYIGKSGKYRYEGEWKDGMKDGPGYEVDYLGEAYKGNFAMDERHGYGTLKNSEGAEYAGNFVKGKKSGYGVFIWPNGSDYIGDFFDDEFNGHGVLTNDKNQIAYEGEWLVGLRHGVGTYRWQDGSKYNGNWFKGKQHGIGSVINKHGLETKGEFCNGVCKKWYAVRN